MIDLKPLGDRAFLARFVTEGDARSWADTVAAQNWPGVVEVVLAYTSAAVYLDPDRADPVDIETRLKALRPDENRHRSGRLIEIPVIYDGDDLNHVARWLGLSEAEVVRHHSSSIYTVFAIGFLPGFPYSGYLVEPLAGLPRRERPRNRVPAGSVAIAGRQTGIYPQDSPGGWHILGRTLLRIVDLDRCFFPIRAGDRLQFVSVEIQ